MAGFKDLSKKNNGTADAIMRWPRPTAFFLITIMFVLGWYNPEKFTQFADACGKLPDNFYNIIYIVLGSIAPNKLIGSRLPKL